MDVTLNPTQWKGREPSFLFEKEVDKDVEPLLYEEGKNPLQPEMQKRTTKRNH